MLKELGVVVGSHTKAGAIFEKLFPDFMEYKYSKPSEYVKELWSKYEKTPDRNSGLNGKIFEYILASLCIREGILPFYMSAKVAFVPNVIFDLMFFTSERGPICWSVKTSLRERYKQADLESIALKYVHRKSLSYLITLNKSEAASVKSKIKSGDVIGLDDVLVTTETEFDKLVTDLKLLDFEEPPVVRVIESTQVVTEEKVNGVFGAQ